MQHYNVGRPRAATRGVAAVLANHMLQLAASYDLIALMRPRSTITMVGNALDFEALLRWLETRYNSFVFFNFYSTISRMKKNGRKRSFETCSLVSRLHWL